MKIEIKPISKKINEWKPQISTQQYFSVEDINKIIEEEKLKEDMVCVQNVSFNSATQTFSNVVIASEKYNGEFIFLVKTENAIKNRNYFFAHITQKNWNTSMKIVLDLTIDPVSSNLDLFNDNKFNGEIYIERTNNYLRCVNDTHSEVCVNIKNQKEKYNLTNIEIDKEIDIFVEKAIPNAIDKTIRVGFNNYGVLKIHPKGTLIVDKKKYPRVLGSKTFQNVKTLLPIADKLPSLTIKDLLQKYRPEENFNNEYWYFPNDKLLEDFIKELLQLDPIYKKEDARFNNQNLLFEIDTEIFEDKTVRWITIPKIFKKGENKIKNDIITDFEIDLTQELKNYNYKSHLFLHYNYFLVWNRMFKIPINIIKNKGIIYGIREIINEGVKFSFFNDEQKSDLFFEQIFSLQNALLSDDYVKFEKDLLISRNAGLINNQNGGFGENVLNQILNASSTFLLGTLASGGNPLIGGATAIGAGAVGVAGSIMTVPFNRWKEEKQLRYERMKIENLNKTPRAETTLDNLFKMLQKNNIILSWAWVSWQFEVAIKTPDGRTTKTDKGYCILENSELSLPNYTNKLALIIEQPLECDIEKIEIDQKRYGNIVNEFKINDPNYQNPLMFNEHTPEFLFWQGKINPNNNPIDNFQLDFLNETLARGISIIKIRLIEAEAKAKAEAEAKAKAEAEAEAKAKAEAEAKADLKMRADVNLFLDDVAKIGGIPSAITYAEEPISTFLIWKTKTEANLATEEEANFINKFKEWKKITKAPETITEVPTEVLTEVPAEEPTEIPELLKTSLSEIEHDKAFKQKIFNLVTNHQDSVTEIIKLINQQKKFKYLSQYDVKYYSRLIIRKPPSTGTFWHCELTAKETSSSFKGWWSVNVHISD